jgi:hypothetical protein
VSGIVGTAAADNAQAGSVGEVLTQTTLLTTATTGVLLNAATISLTAGDWDVYGLIQTNPAVTTTQSAVSCGISGTSATYATISGGFVNAVNLYSSIPAGDSINMQAFATRINVSATTNVYLVAGAAFLISTLTIDGYIWARRRR